jgi:hypothetical protein
MKVRKPTQKEKIEMYEKLLHDIDLSCSVGRTDLLEILLGNINSWSYAHRCGNGEYSEKEQNQLIYKKFWKLATIPDILK